MSKYIHEEGTDTSFSYASEIMQNLANNDIRNATKIITLTPGFLPNSFVPAAVEKDPTNPSMFILRMTAGPAIFPNGEVFCGGNFKCSVEIQKNQAPQYLKLVHQELKRSKTRMSYGAETVYSEILDGARLILTTSEDFASDELGIAKISYPLVASKPKIEIIKQEWKFYWSGATIIDPNESILVTALTPSLSLSMISSKALGNNPSIMHNQASLLRRLRLAPAAEVNGWDLVPESDQTLGYKFSQKKVYPQLSQPGTLGDLANLEVPPGVSFNVRIRKADAYRSQISTDWTEIDLPCDETEGALSIGTMVHRNLPIIAVRVYGLEANIPEHSFAQIWIAEGSEPDVANSHPSLEIPIQRISLPAPEGISYPYVLFYCNTSASEIQLKYRLVNPELHVGEIGSVTMGSYSQSIAGTRDVIMDLNVGCDRLNISDLDNLTKDTDGARIYFNKSTIRFYLPRRAPASGAQGNQKRYLKKVKLVNYKPAEAGSKILDTGTASVAAPYLRLSGGTAWAIDIKIGSYVHMEPWSVTPDVLPSGRMYVEAKHAGDGWIDVSPVYYPLSSLLTDVNVYKDNESMCDMTLYNVSSEDEFIVGPSPMLIAGASSVNALAGFAGSSPDFNAAFPIGPYVAEYQPPAGSIELQEGSWYEFRFGGTIVGESQYFDMVGKITLTLSEA